MSLLFWIYYERIIFAEERFLERKFGKNFTDWSNKTPAFLPKSFHLKKSKISFSFRSVLRREYAGVFSTVVSYSFIDLFRLSFETNNISISPIVLKILIIVSIIVFILRSLKHYTNILEEKDRS